MNLGGSIHVIYNHWVHFWFYLACYQCANAIVKSYKIIGTVSKIFPSILFVYNYTNFFLNHCHADFHHEVGMFAWVSHEEAVRTECRNSNQNWEDKTFLFLFRPPVKQTKSQKSAIFWPLTSENSDLLTLDPTFSWESVLLRDLESPLWTMLSGFEPTAAIKEDTPH